MFYRKVYARYISWSVWFSDLPPVSIFRVVLFKGSFVKYMSFIWSSLTGFLIENLDVSISLCNLSRTRHPSF